MFSAGASTYPASKLYFGEQLTEAVLKTNRPSVSLSLLHFTDPRLAK